MARQSQAGNDVLVMALAGYEAEKKRIDAAIADLQSRLGRKGPKASSGAVSSASSRKRVLSESARERIAEAQKKRWAAFKKGPAAKKTKRVLSPEGRARIIEATKRRWAAQRKASVSE